MESSGGSNFNNLEDCFKFTEKLNRLEARVETLEQKLEMKELADGLKAELPNEQIANAIDVEVPDGDDELTDHLASGKLNEEKEYKQYEADFTGLEDEQDDEQVVGMLSIDDAFGAEQEMVAEQLGHQQQFSTAMAVESEEEFVSNLKSQATGDMDIPDEETAMNMINSNTNSLGMTENGEMQQQQYQNEHESEDEEPIGNQMAAQDEEDHQLLLEKDVVLRVQLTGEGNNATGTNTDGIAALTKMVAEQLMVNLEVKVSGSNLEGQAQQATDDKDEQEQQQQEYVEDLVSNNISAELGIDNENEETQQQYQQNGQDDELIGKKLWTENRWGNKVSAAAGQQVEQPVRLSEDGLVAENDKKTGVDVRAELPISREELASMADPKLVYYEIRMKNERVTGIGWVDPGFMPNGDNRVGEHPGSYAIGHWGTCWESGCHKLADYNKKFRAGDVIGSGLLLTQGGQLKLFFTQNGQLCGKPIALTSQDSPLFPAVSFCFENTWVEANFGAAPEEKPFAFNIGAHLAQLFETD